MKIKAIFLNILISVFAAVLTIVVYTSVMNNNDFSDQERNSVSKTGLSDDTNNVHYAGMPVFNDGGITDFTVAAEKSVNAVVHVTSKYNLENNYSRNPIYELFFGNGYYNQPVMSFGSGVIISDDGYIVTNYHVVEKSEQLEVILNDRRSFTAEIVGTDPNTDLALLKVKETNLPFIPFGNSDNVRIGEWVLAVGNPFNLTSTVTAGIVSAKARSITTAGERGFSPESYIQTDAAVNKGNSGGALVNLGGELIGINSAILSPSGSYTGYSFAIPANIVKKVIGDLIKYGEVQRAVLGVEIKEVDKKIEEELALDKIEGVYIERVTEKGAAELAGIKSKDIILSINNVAVNSMTELTEQMGKYRPGEKVSIIVKRDNKKKQFDVLLRNTQGNTDIVRADQYETMLGADLQRLSSNDKRRLGLDYGLVVLKLKDGALKDAGIKESFIITNIQGEKMDSVDDLRNVLSKYKSGDEIEIEGTYPGGRYIYIYKVEMMRGK
ncbi:MAG: Do family serine endopeptidase [Bacteroidales bacterium]|jgi:Do/DeqQ family serine protease|nr:Do family serine endopeptidase [Bacteroidales bacterium]